jgi:cytochrome c biogenesis protein CcmG/thiol:disulfide interchange protein DsbE
MAGNWQVKRPAAATLACGWLLLAALDAPADEHLAVLRVGSETYSNVTITGVTATDIYFSSAGGMGNAKLKNLDPELQRHFGFNALKAWSAETRQKQADAQFRTELANRKPAAPRAEPPAKPPKTDDRPDVVDPSIHARSFRGRPAPEFVAEKWLTPPPDTAGKFVLIDFWATWCGPCRRSIPLLNAIQERYRDRLVVIGLSAESEAEVRRMTSPQIHYTVAIDTAHRLASVVGVEAIPHTLLIDPKGIVRYEGNPLYLNSQAALEHLLDKYSD